MAGDDKVQPLDAMRRSAQQQAESPIAEPRSTIPMIVKTARDREILQMLHNQGLQTKAQIKALEGQPKNPETEQRLTELWDHLDGIAALNARIIQGQRPRR